MFQVEAESPHFFIPSLLDDEEKHAHFSTVLQARSSLEQVARQTWNFLQNHLDPNTALPFDRVEKKNGEVHLRKITSPSNIGLALLSCVAVDQLSYIDSDQALAQASILVHSIESLETRSGMFLNWYHTDTCEPVVYWPTDSGEVCVVEEFISSVDNAWLAIGLIIASEHFPELKDRIDAILDKMSFCVFFDENRGSFAGGIHQSGKLSDYHFPSTFLSEARILYYVSYLLNQISRETLQRYLAQFPSSSYGGSVFETLMPALVFDEYELSVETILNLINLQREAGKEHGYWGYSPCDNPGKSYQEFGVGEYGKNGFDVVTPHALFLALPYAPVEVFEALDRLSGMTGTWTENGFVDSVNVRDGTTSDTWLYLDQAMILLSIYQVLETDTFRKRVI